MLRFILVVCLMLFVVTAQIFAQQPKEDVLHFRNGSVIRGTIIELIPRELLLKIKAQDGNVFIYKIDELAKVSIERASLSYQRRDPWIAAGLSIILPGGGQIYNKQYGKGAVLFGVTVIGAILATRNAEGGLIRGSEKDYKAIRDDLVDFNEPNDVGLVLGGVLCVGGYVYSLYDAPKTAKKINQQGYFYGHLIEFDRDRTMLAIDPTVSRNGFGTMLTLHW